MRPAEFRRLYREHGPKAWIPSTAYLPPCDETCFAKYNQTFYIRAGLWSTFRTSSPEDSYLQTEKELDLSDSERERAERRLSEAKAGLINAWMKLGLHDYVTKKSTSAGTMSK
jgi:hypothetical protein